MTKHQIALVQNSYARLADDKARFGMSFCAQLLALDPSLAPKFAGVDMEQHVQKLMGALSFVVGALEQPETIAGAVVKLGARHATYGVRAEHYATAGRALKLTLCELLHEAWSAELSEAWDAAYGDVSGLMLSGADTAPAPLAA